MVATMFEPPLRLARVMELSLDDLNHLIATGYFRELKSRRYSCEPMDRLLGRSRRTVATLSKTSVEDAPQLEGGERIRWRREAVRLLGGRTWPPSLTCAPAGSSGGRSPITCAPNSSSRH